MMKTFKDYKQMILDGLEGIADTADRHEAHIDPKLGNYPFNLDIRDLIVKVNGWEIVSPQSFTLYISSLEEDIDTPNYNEYESEEIETLIKIAAGFKYHRFEIQVYENDTLKTIIAGSVIDNKINIR